MKSDNTDAVSEDDLNAQKRVVNMLRLRRDEALLRETLHLNTEDQQPHQTTVNSLREELTDAKNSYGSMYSTMLDMNHGLEVEVANRDRYIADANKQHETISAELAGVKQHTETLKQQLITANSLTDDLRAVIHKKNENLELLEENLDGCDEELSVRRQDYKVLMAVVENAKRWDATPPAHRSSHLNMREIWNTVVDYLDIPEIPELKLKIPSIGTRVVSSEPEPITISEPVMQAVYRLIECDDDGNPWAVSTGTEASKSENNNQTIDELSTRIAALTRGNDVLQNRCEAHQDINTRLRVSLKRNTREFDELHKQIDAMKQTIDDLRMANWSLVRDTKHDNQVDQRNREELDRLRKIVETADGEVKRLTGICQYQCDQLGAIENLIPGGSISKLKYELICDIREILKEK